VLIESGGDNLAATFSPELADLTIYVIDVAAGDKIPRKGGPASPLRPPGDQQNRPGAIGRGEPGGDGPRRTAHARRAAVVFTNLKTGDGVDGIVDFVVIHGGL